MSAASPWFQKPSDRRWCWRPYAPSYQMNGPLGESKELIYTQTVWGFWGLIGFNRFKCTCAYLKRQDIYGRENEWKWWFASRLSCFSQPFFRDFAVKITGMWSVYIYISDRYPCSDFRLQTHCGKLPRTWTTKWRGTGSGRMWSGSSRILAGATLIIRVIGPWLRIETHGWGLGIDHFKKPHISQWCDMMGSMGHV